MSEPFLERLSRFTPDPGGLDRDALLFAAGRASAGPQRRWKALAALLAASHLLTLALLWPAALPDSDSPTQIATSAQPAEGHSPLPAMPTAPGVWSMRQRLFEQEPAEKPVESVTVVESGPPLRAFTAPPAWVLN